MYGGRGEMKKEAKSCHSVTFGLLNPSPSASLEYDDCESGRARKRLIIIFGNSNERKRRRKSSQTSE